MDEEPTRAERRTRHVREMLASSPRHRYAVQGDDSDPDHPGHVVLAVAIRQADGAIFTTDVLVPTRRYEGTDVVLLAEKQGMAWTTEKRKAV